MALQSTAKLSLLLLPHYGEKLVKIICQCAQYWNRAYLSLMWSGRADCSLPFQTLRMREAITKLPHMSSRCSD
jgi:hypothetical protein